MKYYHGTTYSKADSILQDRKIRTGVDGIVYLADSLENALKFISVKTFGFLSTRMFGESVIIFEIDVPDDENELVKETFDHSYKFFQCKSYGYPKNIPLSWITDAKKYQ